MAKQKALSDPQPASEALPLPARPERSAQPVSRALIGAFALVLIGGAAFGISRPARLESEFVHALNNCGASLLAVRNGPERNGLEDLFAVVEFSQHRNAIARFLGYCETHPELARNVFRRALDEGNRSARMVGLGGAFYLAHAKHMTAGDWDRVVARLNPERESELDVRRVAQRTVGDLLLIKERPTKGELLATPGGFKEPESDAPTARTELREFSYEGNKYFIARWTSPALAWAWLQEQGKSGKWDEKLQRFVVE